jgi:hypothetical protein
MAGRILCAVAVWTAGAGVIAQPPAAVPVPMPAAPSVPTVVPMEAVSLPAGMDVSRPLSAVQPPAESPAVVPPTDFAKAAETPPAPGRSRWDSWDFLLWWYKAQPIPPLVTASAPGTPPTLDSTTTRVLVGGRQLASGPDGGGRFVYGAGPGEALIGYEAVYMFLGGNTGRFDSTDVANRNLVLGRPFFNSQTNRNDAVIVRGPAVPTGYVSVATSTRVSSWEVNGVGSLYDGPNGSLFLLAGYRYFRLKDGLHVEQAVVAPGGIVLAAADQFDTQNQFHGAQLGVKADYTAGPVFVEFSGKVALGQNNEAITSAGQTNLYSGAAAAALPGGVLALASNSGRSSLGTFAVLPEAQVKFGFNFGDRSRFSVGYNLIYLNDAVRPGDQIDRVIDPAQLPPAVGSADRPAVPFKRTDFWVQGLVFSWDTRY